MGSGNRMKASLLVKFFQPLLSNYCVSTVDFNSTVQKARVDIHLPAANKHGACNMEKPIKFNAGLATPLVFDATVEYMVDPLHNLRIQIDYPDSTSQFFLLRTNDVRKLSAYKHRITSTVQLSHVKWSSVSTVRLSLVHRACILGASITSAADDGGGSSTASHRFNTEDDHRSIVVGKPVTIAVQT